MSKSYLIYFIEFVLFMIAALHIQPIDDDWFFARYFENSSNWGITPYVWLNDFRLLPRDYWRPIEDIIYSFQQKYHPSWFPYFNHILTICLCFGTGIIVMKIAKRFGFNKGKVLIIISLCMFFPTNMGTLFSCDGFAQSSVLFWGLLCTYSYVTSWRYKKLFWLITGILACFSKETGVIFFVVGPILKILLDSYYKKENNFSHIFNWRNVKKETITIIPILLYVSIYVICISQQRLYADSKMKASVEQVSLAKNILKTTENDNNFIGNMTSSQKSHKLTPTTFIKNVFILYFASIYPIDTSAVYYKNWATLGFSALLSLSGLILLLVLYRSLEQDKRILIWGFVFILLVVSLPSLITRAGELSPITSNTFLMLIFVVLIMCNSIKRREKTLLCIFFLSSFLTDVHKYSLAFEGGATGRKMANEIVEKTKRIPLKVLVISRDESHLDKAGAAFCRSPFKAFYGGLAAVRAYDYKAPLKIDKIMVPIDGFKPIIIDSIIETNKNKGYDCIWISENDKVNVLNL